MRTGWSDSDLAVENALAAESAGVSALAMHGRTREQMYTGHCDHETLARVAKAITKIPFIGNGDVRSVQDAKLMIEELGVSCSYEQSLHFHANQPLLRNRRGVARTSI